MVYLLALLRLPWDHRTLRFSPACLPASPAYATLSRDADSDADDAFLGVRCITSGWGQEVFGGELTEELREVICVLNSHMKLQYEIRTITIKIKAIPAFILSR